MNTKTCGKCVPVEDFDRLRREWNYMCALCVVLMLLVAVGGVLSLEWRRELLDTKQQLTNATDAQAARDLVDAKVLKPNVKEARKGN